MAGSAFAGNQGTTMTANKTANVTQTRTDTYHWNVTKTVKPEQRDRIVIPQGQSTAVDFQVSATRTGPDTAYTNSPISGTITLFSGDHDTIGLWVTDQLEKSTDGGETWTTVAGPILITSTDIPANSTPTYPYSFDYDLGTPGAIYRDHLIVMLDNFVGHEGEPWTINYYENVTITPALVEIDKTALLEDVFAFDPAGGFSASKAWSSMPLSDSLPLQTYTVTLTNDSVGCGQTVAGTNTLTLTPSINSALPPAPATVQIYSGTCHPTRH